MGGRQCLFLAAVAGASNAVAPQAPSRIFFLHIHKSAGTFMCLNAQHNNMTVNVSGNCNVQQNQRCCGGDTVKEHIEFARASPYTFVANERLMYESIVPALFTYVVILRKPWDRYMSHYRHVSRAYRQPYTKAAFTRWLNGQPDNWAARQICGTRCANRTKGALTLSDIMYIKQRLKLFSHVARLEHPEEISALTRALRWRPLSPNQRVNGGGGYEKWAQPPAAKFMTAIDDCIYARTLGPLCAAPYKTARALGHPLPCGTVCTTY